MIEEINFTHYRKFKEITIPFSKNINVISGTNGTCKSTLMHIISNSFQAIKSNDPRYKDSTAISLLKRFVDKLNPKIESISRGDKNTYKNPAEGKTGTLFTVKYTDSIKIDFRRHNTTDETKKSNHRFSIKPQYGIRKKDKLPDVPVVYLGLSRLFPYGELSDAHQVDRPNGQLPANIHADFVKQYKLITGIEIVKALNQNVVDVKKRNDFTTTNEGIDSNTISSGEDNLSIILTALNCLRNITESVVTGLERDIESVLLIDEFDASLHPSAQKKLYDIICEYSDLYRIQVFFTTHSLYILKYAYDNKNNILYFVDQIDRVSTMLDPSPMQIELHLNDQIYSKLYKNVFIPVYTEDDEARFILEKILDYISKTFDPGFAKARVLLHMVQAKIGSDSLRSLFTDSKLDQSSMRAICILDGDQNKDLKSHIITLPGRDNPEKVLTKYARKLVSEDSHREFWQEVQSYGYSRSNSRSIIGDIDLIESQITELKRDGKSTLGKSRALYKKHFNDNIEFYEKVFSAWLVDPANRQGIIDFRNDLFSVFRKTAPLHQVDSKIWELAKLE